MMGIYGNLVSTRTADMPFPQGFGDRSKGGKFSDEIDCDLPDCVPDAGLRKAVFRRVGLGPGSRVVRLCRRLLLPQSNDA
jgi:hypothetical protein